MRISTPDSNEVEFTFEDKKLKAYEGEPIAIALLANGIRRISNSGMGRKRGAFYIGPAPVTVNGRKRVDSRTTLVKQGMEIRRGNYLDYEPVPYVEKTETEKVYEVVIIGAGPAGLGAAKEISKYARVAVLEKRPHIGGRAYLREEMEPERGDVKDLYLNTTALGIFDKGEYLLVPAVRDNEFIEFYAKRVIIAAGGIERTMLFENNDMPGVFRASMALDAIVRRKVKPGEKIAVVGKEPELVSKVLDAYNLDYILVQNPKRVEGKNHVERLIDFDGNVYEVDAVIVSDGRIPDTNPSTQPGGKVEFKHGYIKPKTDERLRVVPKIYVTGSAYAIMATHKDAYEHGRMVGTLVLEDLGYVSEHKDYEPKIKEYPIEKIPVDKLNMSEVFICGCDVTLEKVHDVIASGITELQILKRLTHVAMGFCQGRYCLFNTAKLVAQLSGRNIEELDIPVARPPLRPTKMGVVL